MEPSRKSILTAARTVPLATDLGIPRCLGVGNKARMPEDGIFFEEVCAASGVDLGAIIPLDAAIPAADRAGTGVTGIEGGAARTAIDALVDRLDALDLASR